MHALFQLVVLNSLCQSPPFFVLFYFFFVDDHFIHFAALHTVYVCFWLFGDVARTSLGERGEITTLIANASDDAGSTRLAGMICHFRNDQPKCSKSKKNSNKISKKSSRYSPIL